MKTMNATLAVLLVIAGMGSAIIAPTVESWVLWFILAGIFVRLLGIPAYEYWYKYLNSN